MAGSISPSMAAPPKTQRPLPEALTRFGPQVLPEGQGVCFRLWAPSARTVELVLKTTSQAPEQILPMPAQTAGWYQLIAPNAKAGSHYKFRIDGDLAVPDPASRFQPEDAHGWSEVVDLGQASAKETAWTGRPWEEVVLYELHVGTFTPEGTFQALQQKLDYLKDLGITAIELMPLADFPGQRNWGYDGVLQFAPDSAYGTPADLKNLIQAAHDKGLMVFLDVVYNHFGPDGNYLHVYAKSFFTEHYHTPWGAALNFEGQPEVRQFFMQNALYWLKDYGFDGLRFDAVHAIYDGATPHFLEELATTVRQHIEPDRHVHLVLENDDNSARWIGGDPKTTYNAQWNDDFHHAAHVIATGETGGYYEDYAEAKTQQSAVAHFARCLSEGFAYQGQASPFRDNAPRGETSAHLPTTAFVNFLQNHDQIGNRAFGDRLHASADPEALKALLACLLLGPGIPLIYMGQEWETKTPFQFFCDFGGELAELVTQGRRSEFAKFPEFANPNNQARIPDPSASSTFERSKLNWQELAEPAHAEWLAFYRELLALRAREIVPRLALIENGHGKAHNYEVFETSGIQVRWRLSGGQSLLLTANLGGQPLTAPAPITHNLKSERLKLVYSNRHGKAGSPQDLEISQLAAWSVIWQVGEIV